jgi:hypothetical protein
VESPRVQPVQPAKPLMPPLVHLPVQVQVQPEPEPQQHEPSLEEQVAQIYNTYADEATDCTTWIGGLEETNDLCDGMDNKDTLDFIANLPID